MIRISFGVMLDDLAVADQQADAAEVDARPYRRDGVKFVTGPAEALGLVAVAGGEEGSQAAQGGLPSGLSATSGGRGARRRSASASRRRWTASG